MMGMKDGKELHMRKLHRLQETVADITDIDVSEVCLEGEIMTSIYMVGVTIGIDLALPIDR